MILVSTIVEFSKKFFGEFYVILLPFLVGFLHAGHAQIQWGISIFYFAVMIAEFFAGPLSDRWGKRELLLGMLPIFVLGNLLFVCFPSLWMFWVAMALMGLGIGAGPSIAKAVQSEIAADGAQRVRFFIYTGYVVNWAPSLGLIIGGNIIHYVNWRFAFLLSAMLGVVIFLIVALFFPRTQVPPSPRSFFSGYQHILKSPSVCWLILGFGAFSSCVLFYYLCSTFVYRFDLHISAHTIGWLSLVIGLSNMIGKTVALSFIKTVSERHMMAFGLTLSAVATVLVFVLSRVFGLHLLTILLPMVLFMVGFGMTMPLLRNQIYSIAPPGISTGSIASLSNLSINFFSSVGTFLIALFHFKSVSAMAMVLAAAVALAAITAFRRLGF